MDLPVLRDVLMIAVGMAVGVKCAQELWAAGFQLDLLLLAALAFGIAAYYFVRLIRLMMSARRKLSIGKSESD